VTTSPSRAGGRPDKRSDVTRAARAVFGRLGYAQASMDVIAAEAAVSTRTIYQHFKTKDELFATVLEDSAREVADHFAATVDRTMSGADLREDLIALGAAFVAQTTDQPEHFAMVRQIRADALQLPSEVIDRWHLAGPLRVQTEVADRLRALADLGQLRLDSSELAALHFIALVTAPTTIRPYAAAAPEPRETVAAVTASVTAFLTGYGTSPAPA